MIPQTSNEAKLIIDEINKLRYELSERKKFGFGSINDWLSYSKDYAERFKVLTDKLSKLPN